VDALEIKTVFTLTLFGREIPVTETVIVSWAVMAILMAAALVFTRNLKETPRGVQALIETAVEFVNNFSRSYFGRWAGFLGVYLGTLFLFLLLANLMGVLSPVSFSFFGRLFKAPFEIKPPTKDISVTAAFAAISIFLVLFLGILSRGIAGWFKQLFYPLPIMLPFNLMDYATRLLSLCLRLFGNILGGYVLMGMIQGIFPAGLPVIGSLYFDFFDGLMQAAIFVFLTSIYIQEAVTVNHET
jgi:F-type H+-transporting ATPase subunit a